MLIQVLVEGMEEEVLIFISIVLPSSIVIFEFILHLIRLGLLKKFCHAEVNYHLQHIV